jgi:hypothetical protein
VFSLGPLARKVTTPEPSFRPPHIYSISARHTGDACGFYGDYREARSARRGLAYFLERSLEFCDDLQMYVALIDYGDSGVVPSKFDYQATLSPGCGDSTQVISSRSSEMTAEQRILHSANARDSSVSEICFILGGTVLAPAWILETSFRSLVVTYPFR